MISDKVIGAVEGGLRFFLDTVGNNIDSVIEIDTALSEKVLVARDGSMVTLIELKGNVTEDDDFYSIKSRTDSINEQIKSYISDGDHDFHVTFRNETGESNEIVRKVQSRALEASSSIGWDMGALFESQENTLASRIVSEKVYVALWSYPSALSSTEVKRDSNEAESEQDEQVENVLGKSKQSLGYKYKSLLRKHSEFVKTACTALQQFGCIIAVLDRNSAIASSAKVFQPFLPNGYSFIFPDSDYVAKAADVKSLSKGSSADALWPSLSSQVIMQDVLDEDISENILTVDDYKFTTFEVSVPPRNLVVFNELANSIDSSEVPYQISFKVKSDLGFSVFWKKAMSHIPYPATNGRLKNAIGAVDSLKLLGENSVEYKISVSTWSRDGEKLLDQKEHLKRKVAGWGSSQVRNFKGSPLKALVDSVPSLSTNVFGSTSYAPLLGLLPQLPLSRTTEVWEKSSLSFVTEDGKLFPFAGTSNSAQRFWNMGVAATMGSGKSVLLQCIALSHVLNHISNGEIPFVGYLDIGFSAVNMIEMLRGIVPDEQRHMFLHKTLQNHKDHALNIHDTQLGCRYPDMDQKKFMTNFYLTLLTPAGQDTPNPELEGIVKQALTDAYKYRSDDQKPKEYSKGKDAELDAILEPYGVTSSASYWDLVDLLFSKNNIKGALRAQRYAVPTIDDIVGQLNQSTNIKQNFSTVTVENSTELLIDYTSRQLTLAVESYPLIAHPTNLDVDDARFIVLDLNDVAKGGDTAAGRKDTSVFYTLGRFIVTRNFFISEDLLKVVPETYMKYHTERVKKFRSIPKLTVYDEFHRAGHVKSLVDTVITEMREARKWNLSILMASQLLKDFSPALQSLIGTMFVLSNDAAKDDEEAKSRIPFNKYLFKYYKSFLTGPDGARGTPFIAQFKLKKRVVAQSLRFVLSPYYYWMTTSDAVDNQLVRAMAERTTRTEIMRILTKAHPMGVREAIETLTNEHPDQTVRNNPVGHLVNQLLS
ncbi:putative enzyme [Vibrio chagasii]|nr:putative enzyme [Vibrio chagasii]